MFVCLRKTGKLFHSFKPAWAHGYKNIEACIHGLGLKFNPTSEAVLGVWVIDSTTGCTDHPRTANFYQGLQKTAVMMQPVHH